MSIEPAKSRNLTKTGARWLTVAAAVVVALVVLRVVGLIVSSVFFVLQVAVVAAIVFIGFKILRGPPDR